MCLNGQYSHSWAAMPLKPSLIALGDIEVLFVCEDFSNIISMTKSYTYQFFVSTHP